jgi:hypothetical protein
MPPAKSKEFRNYQRLLRFLLLVFLAPLSACDQGPIGVVTTTNYCLKGTTSSSQKIEPGFIALSRDLEKKHHLKFGDLIYVENETEPYIFMDRMPPHWKRHADLYSRRCKDAKEYGVQKRMLWFVRQTSRKW